MNISLNAKDLRLYPTHNRRNDLCMYDEIPEDEDDDDADQFHHEKINKSQTMDQMPLSAMQSCNGSCAWHLHELVDFLPSS